MRLDSGTDTLARSAVTTSSLARMRPGAWSPYQVDVTATPMAMQTALQRKSSAAPLAMAISACATPQPQAARGGMRSGDGHAGEYRRLSAHQGVAARQSGKQGDGEVEQVRLRARQDLARHGLGRREPRE